MSAARASHGSPKVANCRHHGRSIAAAATRREWMTGVVSSTLLLVSDSAQALPLAPLGKVKSNGEKLTNLSLEEVKVRHTINLMIGSLPSAVTCCSILAAPVQMEVVM